MMSQDVNTLVGKTLVDISIKDKGNEILRFVFDDGSVYEMYHDQNCCESVYLYDIIGDMGSLIGSPLTMAEEVTSRIDPEGYKGDAHYDSFTWTFYKFATLKGYVTLRWLGESNGYYSETVGLYKV